MSVEKDWNIENMVGSSENRYVGVSMKYEGLGITC
jgi:hypothetical protein